MASPSVPTRPSPRSPIAPVTPEGRTRRDALETVLSSPRVLQLTFRFLRIFPTIRVWPFRYVLVSRAADVRTVMERDEDFTLAHFNAPVMPGGAFVLGMDRGDRWAEEHEILQQTLGNPGIGWTEPFDFARDAVARVKETGRIDMVSDLALPLAMNTASTHFGVPPPDPLLPGEPKRPEPAELAKTLRRMARRIIAANPESERIRRPADEASGKVAAYVDDLIAWYRARIASAPTPHSVVTPDTVLKRILLNHKAPQDLARRSIIGEISAGTPTVVKAATQAIDQLLRKPKELKKARGAAQRAEDARQRMREQQEASPDDAVVPDEKTLEALEEFDAYINEALRLHPVFPALRRYTPRTTSLNRWIDTRWLKQRFGTLRMKEDLTVLVLPMSAMYDRRAMERPDQFLLGRPQDVYFHYGAGIHTCLGREVAHAQILAITGELLRLKNLRRERGKRGRILWDGPSPHRLVLRFDP